ncbi:alkaline shock response membrane anchor protein AmaP [Fodinicola acaciae]|uniref:alkaline shock response membrane anchor protein AmaP n=1 Tax=Fodinicola acaciae TaxID=2681555 RepID=UPI0013D517C7|nr:alkaline shock response membrane anchor protein AmaP [Fodinicola acaciae]
MNRPAGLNRGLLALIGVIALGAGALVLAVRFRAIATIDPDSPLVPGTALPPVWVWYVVAAVAIVVGLLLLRWLFAQLAIRPAARVWRLEREPARGQTELRTSVAIAPFVEEVSGYPGVHTARANLTGTRERPAVALVVEVEEDGDPAGLRDRLTGEGLPRLRQALDVDDLPATVEFRFTDRRTTRVR